MHFSHVIVFFLAAGALALPSSTRLGNIGERRRSLGSLVGSALGAVESGAAKVAGSVESGAKSALGAAESAGKAALGAAESGASDALSEAKSAIADLEAAGCNIGSRLIPFCSG
jgi:hypothetical protein